MDPADYPRNIIQTYCAVSRVRLSAPRVLMYSLSFSFPCLRPPPSLRPSFSHLLPRLLSFEELIWADGGKTGLRICPLVMVENEHWQTERSNNTPRRMPNCLSCPISGIWLLCFTYSTSNLTSTGCNVHPSACRK